MSLLTFFIALVVIGILWYLITTYVPMPPVIITVMNIVIVIITICLLLALFGVMELPFALK